MSLGFIQKGQSGDSKNVENLPAGVWTDLVPGYTVFITFTTVPGVVFTYITYASMLQNELNIVEFSKYVMVYGLRYLLL